MENPDFEFLWKGSTISVYVAKKIYIMHNGKNDKNYVFRFSIDKSGKKITATPMTSDDVVAETILAPDFIKLFIREYTDYLLNKAIRG